MKNSKEYERYPSFSLIWRRKRITPPSFVIHHTIHHHLLILTLDSQKIAREETKTWWWRHKILSCKEYTPRNIILILLISSLCHHHHLTIIIFVPFPRRHHDISLLILQIFSRWSYIPNIPENSHHIHHDHFTASFSRPLMSQRWWWRKERATSLCFPSLLKTLGFWWSNRETRWEAKRWGERFEGGNVDCWEGESFLLLNSWVGRQTGRQNCWFDKKEVLRETDWKRKKCEGKIYPKTLIKSHSCLNCSILSSHRFAPLSSGLGTLERWKNIFSFLLEWIYK